MAANPYEQFDLPDSDFSANIKVESGGKQFDKQGKPLTSSAGAIGIAQVMPDTAPEAAKLAGVEWDPYAYKFDADYNEKLGKAYHKKQKETFGGDLEKADAAYNAGPGALQKAIARADKEGGSWKDYLPGETKNYMPSVAANRSDTTPTKTETPPVKAEDTSNPFAKYDLPSETSIPEEEDPNNPFSALAPPPKPETNWLGTGPKESIGEYFSKGFAGRIATGIAERTGLKEKSLADAVVEPENKPTPSVGESLKAMGKGIMEHPWEATKSLVYEAGRDPELLAPQLWEAWPAKFANMVEKLGALGKVGVTAGRATAIGAGLEGAAQLAEGEYDPNAIATTGIAFGVGGAVGEGVVQGLSRLGKDIKPIDIAKDKTKLSTDEALAKEAIDHQYDINKMKEDVNHADAKEAQVVDEHAGKSNVDVIKDTINNVNESAWNTKVFTNWITNTVKDLDLRNKMTMAIEATLPHDRILTNVEKLVETKKLTDMIKGMEERLSNPNSFWKSEKSKTDFAAKLDRTKFSLDRLNKIGSEEHAIPVLKMIQDRLHATGMKAKALGLINGMRNNYIPHALDWSKSILTREQKVNLMDYLYRETKTAKFNRDFGKARMYETIRELDAVLQRWAESQGLKSTGVVVQRDIAKIMQIYEDSMHTAILYHKAIQHFEVTPMKGTGLTAMVKIAKDVDGTIVNSKEIAKAIENGYVKFNGMGSKIIGDYFVHPDLVDPLSFLFREKDPNMVQRILGSMSYLTKSLNTIGSLFHAYSLTQAGLTAAPSAGLKELGRSISTLSLPFKAALEHFEKGTSKEQVQYALRSGLMIGTEDVNRNVIKDFGNWTDQMLSKYTNKDVKIARLVTDPVYKQIVERMNRFTWDYMHTGQKLHMFNYFSSEMKIRNPHLADNIIGKEVADFVNTTFGGLNWLQVADSVKNKYAKAFAMKAASLQGREWAQILLFAPDWTVSTLRASTNALPKELMKPWKWEVGKGLKDFVNPKTSADLSRRYVFNTAVAWFTILNAINLAMSGHYIWENEDPTRIDRGDGTSMQLAKHSMEFPEWLRDPQKTLGNKLGFVPKALVTMTTGMAYPSPNAPKVKDNTFIGRTLHAAKGGLPFQVGSAMNAPAGEGGKRALMSMLGVPIYGQTKAQFTSPEVLRERKVKRMEAKKERIKKELERKR